MKKLSFFLNCGESLLHVGFNEPLLDEAAGVLLQFDDSAELIQYFAAILEHSKLDFDVDGGVEVDEEVDFNVFDVIHD